MRIRGPFYTLLGAVMVAATFAIPIIYNVSTNLKSDVHHLGGVIAHGVMPGQIPPAAAMPEVATPSQQVAMRWP